jgi:hypothetical protein
MKACGATEEERTRAVALVKAGKSLKEVKAIFSHVEEDYFDRNEDDLLILAGKKKAPKGHWTLPPEKPEEKPADPLA